MKGKIFTTLELSCAALTAVGESWCCSTSASEAAAGTQAGSLSMPHFEGQPSPSLKQHDGLTTLGPEFRTMLNFRCSVAGWRRSYRNLGTQPHRDRRRQYDPHQRTLRTLPGPPDAKQTVWALAMNGIVARG